MLSLTQSTELGTVYRNHEVRALAEIAHERGLAVHMDGARFANALARLNCSPAEATWKAGVDVLSFGATKNGAMAAEAVVVFDKELAQTMPFRRKRAGHLFSKMRFLTTQLEAYLADDLWLKSAKHSNAMARKLADGLQAQKGVRLLHPVQANEIFPIMPVAMKARLEAAGFAVERSRPGRGGLRHAVYRAVRGPDTPAGRSRGRAARPQP